MLLLAYYLSHGWSYRHLKHQSQSDIPLKPPIPHQQTKMHIPHPISTVHSKSNAPQSTSGEVHDFFNFAVHGEVYKKLVHVVVRWHVGGVDLTDSQVSEVGVWRGVPSSGELHDRQAIVEALDELIEGEKRTIDVAKGDEAIALGLVDGLVRMTTTSLRLLKVEKNERSHQWWCPS